LCVSPATAPKLVHETEDAQHEEIVVKDQVQQAAVRVVASELDRRAKPLEHAIRDLQQRVGKVEEGGVAKHDPALQLAVANLSAASQRHTTQLSDLASRVAGADISRGALSDDVRALRADVDALQTQLEQLVGVLQRLTASP
jgi:chromosome segregation ATPase